MSFASSHQDEDNRTLAKNLFKVQLSRFAKNQKGKFEQGFEKFMAKTHFQLKTNVASSIRMIRATVQYQSLRELVKESTY